MKQAIRASVVLVMVRYAATAQQQVTPSVAPSQAPVNRCLINPKYPMSPQMHGRCLAVQEFMRYPGPISPIGDLSLAMMGDETAFHLFNIMATAPILTLTPAQTLTVLDIIHNSFKAPRSIQSPADRKPDKSLALLRMLQATAVDQIVKERIAAESNFLSLPQTVMPIHGDFSKP